MANGADARKHPLAAFSYDEARERARRRVLAETLARPVEECAANEQLANEVSRIHANFRKQAEAHERALHVADVCLGLVDSDDDDEADAAAGARAKKRRKKGRSRPPQKRPSAVRLIKAAGEGQLSDDTEKRVQGALDELGLMHRPLPASQLFGLYARLRRDIVAAIELENAYAQKQYQVAVLKAHLEGLLKMLGITEGELTKSGGGASGAARAASGTGSGAAASVAATASTAQQAGSASTAMQEDAPAQPPATDAQAASTAQPAAANNTESKETSK